MEYLTIYRHEDAIELEAFEFVIEQHENTGQVRVQGLNEYGQVTFFYALMPGDYFTVEYLEDQDEDPRADADSDSKVDADADPNFYFGVGNAEDAEELIRRVTDAARNAFKTAGYGGLL